MAAFINFRSGDRRTILAIGSDGKASLNRSLPQSGWRGYWPISDQLRDRILRSASCQAAIREIAAWDAFHNAVAAWGFGPIATAFYTAVA